MKPPEVPDSSVKARPWLAAALIAIPTRGCRWSDFDIDEVGFIFCGEPAVADHICSAYCAKHRAIAYLKPGETREERDAATEASRNQPIL